jgi:hypothetical protein
VEQQGTDSEEEEGALKAGKGRSLRRLKERKHRGGDLT